ncbi:MAG: four helix bundle protein [Candidatus Doudnabacteria bacterium]|nr:four helix bundle protein [Candidatus Doudnabacteria bacterium]
MPVLQKITDAYKLWHNYLPHLPKLVKYSLAEKINVLFTDVIELALTAGFTSRDHKALLIQKASIKLDTLKYFLQMAWELKALNNKQFAEISTSLVEAGKMLGGWQRQLTKQTPLI